MFIKPLAWLYAANVHKLERKIGYSLKFANIPAPWINGWMICDMTEAWAKHNINAEGVNYFTVGSIMNNLSSRFIRTEKQYQSWLGAYLVKFNEHKDFTVQDHFNLAVADQKNWLKDFGDNNPFIEMSASHTSSPQTIKLGSFEGKLYEFLGGSSHSDVGNNDITIKNRFNMHMMAEVMNLSNSQLNLIGSNFLPKNLPTNYETVILKGFVAIFELEPNVKFVIYGNAATLLNEQGQAVTDYYPALKQDILKAFNAMVIEKL